MNIDAKVEPPKSARKEMQISSTFPVEGWSSDLSMLLVVKFSTIYRHFERSFRAVTSMDHAVGFVKADGKASVPSDYPMPGDLWNRKGLQDV